jgi:hypothetical protein
MSFSGPTAPVSRSETLHQQIPADLLRLSLAVLAAAGITCLGLAGLLVSTAPRWLVALVQPCSLFLLPGYLLECLDANTYAFSETSVIWTSGAFYFCIALLLLFPVSRPSRP